MNRLTILFAGFILLALAAYVLSKRMPSFIRVYVHPRPAPAVIFDRCAIRVDSLELNYHQ